MPYHQLVPQGNPDTEWIARKAMINYTAANAGFQNCYVNPANPYNPWGYGQPYIGDVPRPPYIVTDAPSWQTTTYPWWQVAINESTSTATQPEQAPEQPSNDEAEEDHSGDFADMIREIVRDELSKQRNPQPSAKDIAREVMAEMAKHLREQGRR